VRIHPEDLFPGIRILANTPAIRPSNIHDNMPIVLRLYFSSCACQYEIQNSSIYRELQCKTGSSFPIARQSLRWRRRVLLCRWVWNRVWGVDLRGSACAPAYMHRKGGKIIIEQVTKPAGQTDFLKACGFPARTSDAKKPVRSEV
jgi:hypothetical protein